MFSTYHFTVKKYLDQHRIHHVLPDYIERGWNRSYRQIESMFCEEFKEFSLGVYTIEEQEFNQRSSIIAPDGQIPNSTVRHRLNTRQTSMKTTLQTFRHVFDLPDDLLCSLTLSHSLRNAPNTDDDDEDEDRINANWNDDTDEDHQRQIKDPMKKILEQQREKRRKHDEYHYDYETMDALSLNEILNEIQTNVGKDLKVEEITLIHELMQIINRHEQDQVINIYDQFADAQLIYRFGGVPKLVQALQDIQKAFEQVAMKTNIASIETIIEMLREKDKTYRLAVELLKSFNDSTKKYKQQRQQHSKLIDKSGDISEYDQRVFNIFLNDRIDRLATADATQLLTDLQAFQYRPMKSFSTDRDELMKSLLESLTMIFTRGHLDGIRTVLQTIDSPLSQSLSAYLERIDQSLRMQLNAHEHLILESLIVDHLNALTNQELKIIYERLVQQGTVKRHLNSGDLYQTISTGLMTKIDHDGLIVVIESLNEIPMEIDTLHELRDIFTQIHQYMTNPSSISLEQMQNHLKMAFFIESRNLNERDLRQLSEAMDFYSIAHLPLPEFISIDDQTTFLEQCQGPLIRLCLKRIVHQTNEDPTLDLNRVPSQFFNEQILNLLHQLTDGSDQLNGNLLLHQTKEQLKKNKDLPEKVYRRMIKEKLIEQDQKHKIDTNKKKTTAIIHGIRNIVNQPQDRIKQEQLVDVLEKSDVTLPNKVKDWYKEKSNQSTLPSKSAKVTTKQSNRKQITKVTEPQSKGRTIVKSRPNASKSRKTEVQAPREIIDERKETLPIMNNDPASRSTSSIIPAEINNEASPLQEQGLDDTSAMASEIEEKSPSLVENEQSAPKVSATSDTVPSVETADHQVPVDHSIDSGKAKEDAEIMINTNKEEFQTHMELIEPARVTSGILAENNTIHVGMIKDAALLLFPATELSSFSDRSRTMMIGQMATYVNDSSYEKNKAQRILPKSIPASDLRRTREGSLLGIRSSSSNLFLNQSDAVPTAMDASQPAEPRTTITEASAMETIKSTSKIPRRTLNRSLKETENIYISSLTKSLRQLFLRADYNSVKLRKIHEELIVSGHISPLNEFYRSPNDALRVTLDHCLTYEDLIKWTLSLFQTNNKANLIAFAHDLYGIAVELDLALIDRIDYERCMTDVQDQLKQQLQIFTEHDLREINSYLNATTVDNFVHLPRRLNVTSKDRMLTDLHTLVLNLIQYSHTFDAKYRPIQIRLREIGETFKSRSISNLIRKIDEIEKHLAKTFGITLIGLSQRMVNARYAFIK